MGKLNLEDAYRLIHEGCRALAIVEENGFRIDRSVLDANMQRVASDVRRLEDELKSSREWSVWKRRFGAGSNLMSRAQLGKVLFEDLGYSSDRRTAKGDRTSVDDDALMDIDLPFVAAYRQLAKLDKLRGTYMRGILRELCGDFLHPSFNLNIAQTFRSSCDSPNLQNIPFRDPLIRELIRTAFVPREGRWLVELDYGQIEVRVAACYHRDPTMMEYLHDPTKDMHRDMAAEIYLLDQDEVTKQTRHHAKNKFVFPEFYGSYYIQVARDLWKAITRDSLETARGVDLMASLEDRGISSLGDLDPTQKPMEGTFEHHMKRVEDRFWNRRFPVYRDWKDEWYDDYQERGWFQMLTGFQVAGVLQRKQVINYPVQGSAFHCLLWSLIEIQKEIERQGMDTLLVGQIHDSIIADVPPKELDKFLKMARRIMVKKLIEAWDWIVVDLEVEAEVGKRNWFEKKEVEIE